MAIRCLYTDLDGTLLASRSVGIRQSKTQQSHGSRMRGQLGAPTALPGGAGGHSKPAAGRRLPRSEARGRLRAMYSRARSPARSVLIAKPLENPPRGVALLARRAWWAAPARASACLTAGMDPFHGRQAGIERLSPRVCSNVSILDPIHSAAADSSLEKLEPLAADRTEVGSWGPLTGAVQCAVPSGYKTVGALARRPAPHHTVTGGGQTASSAVGGSRGSDREVLGAAHHVAHLTNPSAPRGTSVQERR